MDIANKLVFTTHTYSFSVWWQYTDDGLHMIGLSWGKLIIFNGVIIAFCIISLTCILSFQKYRGKIFLILFYLYVISSFNNTPKHENRFNFLCHLS